MRLAVERLWRDVRFGARAHAKTPLATAAIVVTLSLGIAATAVSFSVARALFMRPLPVEAPDRVVRIYQHQEGSDARYFPISADEIREIREMPHVFDDVVAEQPRPFIIGLAGSYERLWGEAVSDRYFSVLGVRPVLGRFFTAGEGQRDEGLAVLGDGAWARRFARDPSVLGRELHIDGRVYRIIGVAPPDFRGTLLSFTSELWIPQAPEPENGFALARLRDGMTIQHAREALDGLARRLEREYPATNQGVRFAAFVEIDGRVPPPFHAGALGFSALLVVAALLVTAIACANVAGVLLAKAAARRGEIAVRLALGASRGRVIGQLLAESAPLSLAAGALGLLLAWTAVGLLGAIAIPIARGAQLSLDAGLDGVVLGISAAATIMTGVLFGIAPALSASRASLVTPLRSSSPGGSALRGRSAGLLLAAQVAVSMVLLAAGGFFVQSLRHAAGLDLGFDATDVVLTSVDSRVRNDKPEDARRFWSALLEDVRRLPRTRSASLTARLPLELGVVTLPLAPAGFQPRDGEGWPTVEFALVDSGYFDTTRIPLLAGRDFDDRDRAGSRPVVIVNDVVASRFWGGAPAIGRIVANGGGREFEVVGVARRSKYLSVGEEPKPYVYFPMRQGEPQVMTIVARGDGDTSAHLREIAAAIRKADPTVPLYEAGELADRVELALAPTAGAAATLGALSLVALALTSLGLFAAVAQAVSRRTYEIGVRRALGAQNGSVAWLVMRDTAAVTTIGLACGLGAALATAHLLRALLYDVAAADPAVLGGATLMLALVSLASASLPTRRALRLNTAAALRHE